MMVAMKRTPNAGKSLPLVPYVRVSTAGQAASGIGLEAQRRAILDHAQGNGLELAAWQEDAGRSGASMRRRVGLKAALAEVEAGRAAGIIAARIDRLGRSSADVLGLVERAQREGWRLLALDVGLDTTTPAGELVAAALAMAARFEYRRISERQREKHEALRRAGRPRGRQAASPELAELVRALRSEGLSFAAIAHELERRKLPTVRGGTWAPATVRSILLTRERELAAQAV
jgi:DNA invertase Pin-like site-specific DNA recombinase